MVSAGAFAPAPGTVPAILSGVIVPLRTAAVYIIVLTAFAVALATLDLWLAASGAAAQGALWIIIGARSLRWPAAVDEFDPCGDEEDED